MEKTFQIKKLLCWNNQSWTTERGNLYRVTGRASHSAVTDARINVRISTRRKYFLFIWTAFSASSQSCCSAVASVIFCMMFTLGVMRKKSTALK